MTGLRTVARNTLFLSIAQILNPLTSVLLVSAIVRMQGAEALGQYSLVLAIFYIAVSLAGLGLNIPITRAVAVKKDKSSDFLIVSSAVGMVSSSLAIVVVGIFVILLDYPPEIRASSNLLMWAVFPSVIIFFCEAIFLALHKAQYVAGISVSENLCKVAIGLVLLAMGQSVFALFSIILCLRFVACAVYLLLFRILIGSIVPRFDWAVLRELQQVSPVFTANLVMSVVLGRIDIILLSKFGTMAQVGFYSAALKLIQIAQILPSNFMRAVLPTMCEMAQAGTDGLKRLFVRSMRYMSVYGVGAGLGMYLLAGFLIRLFYGDRFVEAVTPLQILTLAIIPLSLTPIYASLLFATMHQLLDFLSNVASTVFLAIFCVLFVPRWGDVGAAMAMVASVTLLLFCLGAFMKTKIFKVNLSREVGWPLLAALLAIAVSTWVRTVSAALQAPTAWMVYAAVIIAFEPVVRRDLVACIRHWRDKTQPRYL